MKRTFVILLCLGLLTGCAPTPTPSSSLAVETPPDVSEPPSLAQDETPDWVSCRIIDGAEEGELLLAELDYALNDRELNHYDGKSVYRLSLNGFRCEEEIQSDGTVLAVTAINNGVSVYLDGEPATPADLEDGMSVEVYELHAYSIGTRENPGGSYYDLCGLYLQVLDDLWQKDPGLNSGITVAGLDLSEAPGELLESEKAALAWRFGELHEVEVVTGSYEQLAEEGYFTQVSSDPERPLYQWEDGCLFTIAPNHDHVGEISFGLPALFFDAQKWRSPLGAYYFSDCSVVWPEQGTWNGYQIGSEAIS